MNLTQFCGVLWLLWTGYWYLASLSASKAKTIENLWQRLQHVVPAVVAFWLIFHHERPPYLGGPYYESLVVRGIGTAVTAAGLLFCVWARVHLGRHWSGIVTLKQGHELIRSGPYRLARHPIYTGFLSAALGSALVVGTADAFVGFAILLVAFMFKMRREEAFLTSEFGASYLQFQQEVAALVPYVY